MADGSFSWSQDANRSKAEVTYYGNVNWLDKGIAPNRYTFFAKLYGKDKSVVTVTNAAYLTITSGVIGKLYLQIRYTGITNIVQHRKKQRLRL